MHVLLLGAVLLASLNQVALGAASIEPPRPLFTLRQDDPRAIYDNTTLLAALGSSQQGIKTLLSHNRYGLADGLPARLTREEPGASLLASAVEAYYLFYPLVDVIVRAEAQGKEFGAFNRWFKINSINSTGNSTLGNGVTHYLSTWIDLSHGPLVFEVPKTEETGFWTITFFDAYLEEYHVLGTQHNGNRGGRWLLVGPDSDPSEHAFYGFDTHRIITAPTLQGTAVGRVAKNTPSVKTFVEEFDITDPRGKQPRSVTSFGYRLTDPERALQAVGNDEPLYFWRVAGEAYLVNTKPGLQNPLARQLADLGFSSENGFQPNEASDLALEALSHAPAIAAQLIEARYLNLGRPERNYWGQWVQDERWGTDYLLGAAIIKGFWIANYVEDASYNYLYLDSQGRPLHGSKTYRISFKESPPHDPRAFWSLQSFNLDVLTYPGPGEQGYGAGYKAQKVITSRDEHLSIRRDGSYDIILSPEKPAELEEGENWLQTFDYNQHLILRVYGPSEEIITDSYAYPPAVLVDDGEAGNPAGNPEEGRLSLRTSRRGGVASLLEGVLGRLGLVL